MKNEKDQFTTSNHQGIGPAEDPSNLSSLGDADARRFVLGFLHEEDLPAAEALEERLFVDEAFAELVQATEEELIDALVSGTLGPEEERRLLGRLSRLDPGGERLAFARCLSSASLGAVGGSSQARFGGPSLLQLLPMAAALALAFWGSYQLTGYRGQSEVQTLESGQWRSGGGLPVLDSGPYEASEIAAVNLDLSANEHAHYRVDLVDPDGLVLESWESLVARETEESVRLTVEIPLSAIRAGAGNAAGDFALDVYGVHEQAEPELLERFPFRYPGEPSQ